MKKISCDDWTTNITRDIHVVLHGEIVHFDTSFSLLVFSLLVFSLTALPPSQPSLPHILLHARIAQFCSTEETFLQDILIINDINNNVVKNDCVNVITITLL